VNAIEEMVDVLSLTDWVVVLEALLVLFLLRELWRAQRREDFDWADALKNRYGKVDPYVVTYLVAFGAATYILIYLARHDHLNESYLIIYLVYGLGMPFAKSVLGAWRPPSFGAADQLKEREDVHTVEGPGSR
jgi:hypothetical protein